MAIHKFIGLMEKGEPIPLFGNGSSIRDYTHVSDLVKGILLAKSNARKGFSCFNLGSGSPVSLLDLVRTLEKVTGHTAYIQFLPEQAGDVDSTFADISLGKEMLGYSPQKSLQEGLEEFWSWKQSVDSRTGAAMRATEA
jgi:UDP-glucuronate 4-epimerase